MRFTPLLIFVLLSLAVCALPPPDGYVNDYANIITSEWKDQINTLITDIEHNTTAEISVVTVQSLNDKPIEEVSLQFLTEWGVGKANDNGIVILVAPAERKYRIEVGYGAEGVITDARAGRIGREILGLYFKQEEYGEGIYHAVEEIGGLLRQDPDIVANYSPRHEFFDMLAPFLIFIGFFFTIVICAVASSRKTPAQKWKTFLTSHTLFVASMITIGIIVPHFAYILSGIFFLIAGFIVFLQMLFGRKPGRGGFWYAGGGFKGGSGGFSFGGGSGGGGGASGGW